MEFIAFLLIPKNIAWTEIYNWWQSNGFGIIWKLVWIQTFCNTTNNSTNNNNNNNHNVFIYLG